MFLVAFYVLLLCSIAVMEEEPRCSKFEFEKNLLETLVRLEFKMDTTVKKLESLEVKHKHEFELQVTNHSLLKDIFETFQQKVDEKFVDVQFAIDNHTQILRDNAASSKTPQKGPHVYFFVKIPKSSLHGERPILTHVVQNVGDSYDINTGLFTCKYEGLYHFAFNVVSKTTNQVYCYFHRNGSQITYTYATGIHNSGSVMANLYLLIGDTIEVQCDSTFVHVSYGSGVFFTGALIRI